MKVIDFLDNEYALVEMKDGSTYIGKGQFWFHTETFVDVRYSGTWNIMELERQRVLAKEAMLSSMDGDK